MTKRKYPALKEGDHVRVIWVDATEQPTAEPDEADIEEFETELRFVQWKTKKGKGRYIVLAHTRSTHTGVWYGTFSLPVGMVRSVIQLQENVDVQEA